MSSQHRMHVAARFLIALAGLAVSAAAVAQPPTPGPRGGDSTARGAANFAGEEELPIRRITLYRSGVGLFQRDGTLAGNAQVQLRFKTEQINDILKSLVLLDLGGGKISAVSYPSKDPLERRLASFGINISDNPPASEILSRLRGTPVRVTTPDGDVSGTIMNVESRPTVVQGQGTTPPAVHNLPWINLLTEHGVRSINLTSVSGFEILDKKLADELNKALAALAEHRAENTKTMDLAFSGDGTRRVVVAYVHEMPVWKTSYRLILADDAGRGREGDAGNRNGAAPKGTSTIHGWAVVENTTDQDWTDVRLALVAGRPVSFQMDLYEPMYTPRPMVPVPMVAGVMPRQYQGGVNADLEVAMEGAAKASERAMYSMSAPGAPPAPASAAPRRMGGAGGARFTADQAAYAETFDLGRALTVDELSSYAAAAQAQGGSVGEIFQYELSTPVTIERQRSAMIPILTSPLESRRVSIFSLADRSDHPMRGVEVRNSSDLQLLPGPIAVFEGSEATGGGSAYAGDAQIGHIPPGDKRLLAYAVDLDVAVLTKPESTSTVTRLRIVDGAIEQTVKSINRVTYAFENKDTKRGRTVLVEHPRLADWTLVEPKEPAEKTQQLYRFELPVESGKSGTLSVVQERIERQAMAVTAIDLPTLMMYRKDGKVSQAVIDAFQQVAQRQSAVNETERAIGEIDRQVQTISTDQGRIRENMKTIDRTTDLYKRYAGKLNEQESQLEELTKRRADEQRRLEERRADLAGYLRDLDVE